MVIGFVWGSFLIWRKMREDYLETDILTLQLLLVAVGAVVAGGWRWWSVGGILLAVAATLAVWCKKKKWDFWEWLDIVTQASLILGLMTVLGVGQWISSLELFVGLWISALVNKYYRRWRWYRSGKRGLVGLIGLLWWMGVWIGIALAQRQPLKLYWLGSAIGVIIALITTIIWRKK